MELLLLIVGIGIFFMVALSAATSPKPIAIVVQQEPRQSDGCLIVLALGVVFLLVLLITGGR